MDRRMSSCCLRTRSMGSASSRSANAWPSHSLEKKPATRRGRTRARSRGSRSPARRRRRRCRRTSRARARSRHDVGPLARVDVAVHVEREPGERPEALRCDASTLQVIDELAVPLVDRVSFAQISCSRSRSSRGQAHLAELAEQVGDIRRMVELKSATKPSRGESISSYSSRICTTLGVFGPSGAWISQPRVRSSSSASGISRRISSGFALWIRTSGKPRRARCGTARP